MNPEVDEQRPGVLGQEHGSPADLVATILINKYKVEILIRRIVFLRHTQLVKLFQDCANFPHSTLIFSIFGRDKIFIKKQC